MPTGKKILLGICGGIAAYKAQLLVREWVLQGAEVKVILTPDAKSFVSPLTLSTLSKNPVMSAFFEAEHGTWTNHVALGLWADAMVIAPATANTLAKMAHGHCDNLLLATYLSARCPVWVAPAMDLDMWAHPATQHNMQTLTQQGVRTIGPGEGLLASGLSGKGRMAEPEEIMTALNSFFQQSHSTTSLAGKKCLITAGPTREALDPVRFISNHSTGKMGYALAETLAERGALVTLVSGPVQMKAQHPNITVVAVQSAKEMLAACEKVHTDMDIAVFSAAVADYAAKEVAEHKIKKTGDTLTLELVKNPDIALTLGGMKKPTQVHVGFALETENEKENALQKLKKKNLDLVVLNSLRDEGAGFGHDTNRVQLLYADGKEEALSLKSKKEVSWDIAHAIEQLCK